MCYVQGNPHLLVRVWVHQQAQVALTVPWTAPLLPPGGPSEAQPWPQPCLSRIKGRPEPCPGPPGQTPDFSHYLALLPWSPAGWWTLLLLLPLSPPWQLWLRGLTARLGLPFWFIFGDLMREIFCIYRKTHRRISCPGQMFKLLYTNPCQVSEERWINPNTVITVKKRGRPLYNRPNFLIRLAHKSPGCLKQYINTSGMPLYVKWNITPTRRQIFCHSNFNPLIYPTHQVYEIMSGFFFWSVFLFGLLLWRKISTCVLQVCLP